MAVAEDSFIFGTVSRTLESRRTFCYNGWTMKRSELIECKQQVIAEIQRTRRALERARGQPGDKGKLRQMEARLDALMAEEGRLRQEIDRARD